MKRGPLDLVTITNGKISKSKKIEFMLFSDYLLYARQVKRNGEWIWQGISSLVILFCLFVWFIFLFFCFCFVFLFFVFCFVFSPYLFSFFLCVLQILEFLVYAEVHRSLVQVQSLPDIQRQSNLFQIKLLEKKVELIVKADSP